MRSVIYPDWNSQISRVIYSKMTEVLFICLLLVFIYPFFFVISGVDPSAPTNDNQEVKIVYNLRMLIPLMCLAIGFLYRGTELIASLWSPILFFPIICLVSAIWSVNPYNTFKYAALDVLYIISIAAICHVLDIEVFCKIIVKVAVFLILASVLMVIAFPRYGLHQLTDGVESEHVGQWRGVFEHKNHLGALASISVFMFLFFGRFVSASFGFRVTCIVAAIACLIFAHSATSWIAICVLCVFYFTIRTVPVSANTLLLIIFGISALAFLVFFFFRDDLVVLVGRDATLTGRTEIWPIVLDAIEQSPLIGFGYYAATFDFIGPILAAATRMHSAHNGYLDVMLGTGFVGLVLLLTLYLSILVAGIRRVKASADLKADCLLMLLFFPISSLFFSFSETALSGVDGVLGSLTFLSLTAIPLYLRSTPTGSTTNLYFRQRRPIVVVASSSGPPFSWVKN